MTEIFKQAMISEELFYLGLAQPPGTENLEPENLQELKEQAREEAYKNGFSQGLSDGLQQADEQARRQRAQMLEQLESLLQALPAALRDSRLELQGEIADIVLAVTQQFFVQQQQSKDAIAQQITAALNQINDKQNLTLTLNPQDLALLQQGELQIDFSQCRELRVIADDSLSLGGCKIRSEHGLFDAGIEGQIERLKQVLLQLKGQKQHG